MTQPTVVAAAQATPTPDVPSATPLYFPVSATKLLVMSVCTLSFYEIYWFYKNWCLIKEREKSDVMPALRALFTYFFCYSLFSKIRGTAKEHNVKVALPAGPLATGWIILTLLWKLSDPYWLVSFCAIFLLVPAQVAANRINTSVTPNHDRNTRFSAGNIATVIIGGLLFIAALFGTFFPET